MLNHVLIAGQNMKSKTCDFLRRGVVYYVHQTGTRTGSIAAAGVTKVCLQFLDFLHVTLTSGPGLQGPHFGACVFGRNKSQLLR